MSLEAHNRGAISLDMIKNRNYHALETESRGHTRIDFSLFVCLSLLNFNLGLKHYKFDEMKGQSGQGHMFGSKVKCSTIRLSHVGYTCSVQNIVIKTYSNDPRYK